jgi:hypothetical protein
MDFPTFQAELRQIAGHVQAFAAIGAMLRLHQAKQQAHPAAQAQLLATVEAVLPGAFDRLNEQQISDALAYVTFLIGEATELFQNPDRLLDGFFGIPPHFKPSAKPPARMSGVSSRSPLIVRD